MKKLLLTCSLVLLVLPLISQSSPAENRLRGKILLQVESNGEAWYVKPEDGQRMYMKDGDSAYALMRDLGLGITNLDLSKIPVGFEDRFECLDSDGDTLCDRLEDGLGTNKYNKDSDNDGYDDGTEVKSDYDPLGTGKLSYDFNLANKLKGKILLQVESNGEAWYINPDDNKRYYMPDGPSAYQIMRFLSLGITNSDLAKIDVEGEVEADEDLSEAQEVLSRALAGEDFASLAREYSDDPASAINGGELGYVIRGIFVPEFEEVIFDKLNVGEIYPEVVESAFGYHIIKKIDQRINEQNEIEVKAAHILFQKDGAEDNEEFVVTPPDDEPNIIVDSLREGDWFRGDSNADITIVEFSDIECPFCQRFHDTMKQIMIDYDGKVNWVYRHFPLTSLHPDAAKKAQATECVGEQAGNDGFWTFLDKLFDQSETLDNISDVASSVSGVDVSQFETCLNSGKYISKVNFQSLEAQEAGARGTPYSVIIYGNQRIAIPGALPYDSVKKSLDSLLQIDTQDTTYEEEWNTYEEPTELPNYVEDPVELPNYVEEITYVEGWNTYDNPVLDFVIEYPNVFSIDDDLSNISDGDLAVLSYDKSFLYITEMPPEVLEEENITNMEELNAFLQTEAGDSYSVEEVTFNQHPFVYIHSNNSNDQIYYTIIGDKLGVVYLSLVNFGTADNQRSISIDMMNTFRLR